MCKKRLFILLLFFGEEYECSFQYLAICITDRSVAFSASSVVNRLLLTTVPAVFLGDRSPIKAINYRSGDFPPRKVVNKGY
ncbi:hypothetical protein [Neobacillus sp. Marseille-QA0830]